jgi:SAM-dependent methyltransferase
MDHETVSRCRCCGSNDLHLVLDLGRQPLANSYPRAPTELPTFPLELMVCASCCHSQLSVVVNPNLMFKDYLYVSGTTRTLREHFANLAREAIGWVQPRPRRVLDLACNDGTLLEAFRDEDCEVQGVDPARNLVALAAGKGLDVIEGFWPQAKPSIQSSFDLITAANVLAHVADPKAFLAAALDSLTPHGAVVLEFPYCRELVLNCEWDTIYHEHLSYFLVAPFLRLLEGLTATVTHARLLPIHGGSLRLAIQRKPGPHCREVLALAGQERQDGLHDLETYRKFAERVESICRTLSDFIDSLVASGRKVIGYGASAKSSTLLNHCTLPLSYLVDDNPLKHGHFTPGRKIPIHPPSRALEEAPGLHVLLLAWNFARETVGNWRKWRGGKGDRAIHYVPEVFCHDIDSDLPFLE